VLFSTIVQCLSTYQTDSSTGVASLRFRFYEYSLEILDISFKKKGRPGSVSYVNYVSLAMIIVISGY
jgi:hypothetical protein